MKRKTDRDKIAGMITAELRTVNATIETMLKQREAGFLWTNESEAILAEYQGKQEAYGKVLDYIVRM